MSINVLNFVFGKKMFYRAIAASAPILEFEGMAKCSAFFRILSSDYETAGEECARGIRKSWGALDQMAKNSENKI